MSNQVGIDPADHAGIHIGDLEQVVNARVSGSTTAVDQLPHPPNFARSCFWSSLMRFINFFVGALVATTSANILLTSNAVAGLSTAGGAVPSNALYPPNGWTQVGHSCLGKSMSVQDSPTDGDTYYYKLSKNSDNSVYGVYRNKRTWMIKSVGLEIANAMMNRKCFNGYNVYQPACRSCLKEMDR